MKFTATKDKITARHLQLLAIVYVRQSTKRQVKENTGSGKYQRKFVDLARQCGWSDELIVVVDQDQGVSGTSSARREGLSWVRQQIFEGRVGAVICAEESRLGRDFSEFAQLVSLCAVYNTLIIDEKGIHDPNNSNDLATMGFFGVLSNVEILRNIQRSITAKKELAEEGTLILSPPTGYIYDDEDKLVFDPDEEVQSSLRLLFCKFDEYGVAMQVTKFFNRNEILFPSRTGGYYLKNTKIVWKRLRVARVLSILHSPIFAGAFVYGRSRVHHEMVSADASEQKKSIVPIKWDGDEVILIKDAHQAYIGWEKFLQNQERIKDNRFVFDLGSSGAVRDGYALLQGRVLCEACLRTVATRYNVRKYASYVCMTEVSEYGLYACLSIAARHLDRAVTDALLEALNPAQVRITLQAMEAADDRPDADQHQGLEAIKQARTEADKLRKIFESVTQENDLVAAEYQQKLQAKLVEIRRLESKLAKTNKAPNRRLPEKVRQSLLALSHDVRSFWESEHVTHEERKRVLRWLIKKVTVKRRADTPYTDVTVHWMTGQKSNLTIISDARFTHPEAIEFMRKLAPTHTIRQIVDQLNQAGFKPAKDDRFTQGIVYDLFRVYGIRIGCRAIPNSEAPRGDGMYPLRAVAKMLNASRQTVTGLYQNGVLEGVREKPRSPLWIKITPEQVSALKRPARSKSGKSKVRRTSKRRNHAG